MGSTTLTDIDVDAAVLLRAHVRRVTHPARLRLGRPVLTFDQVHASLARLSAPRRPLTWYRDTDIVLSNRTDMYLAALTDPAERAALRRAWAAGSGWLGEDLGWYGISGQERRMPPAQFRDREAQQLPAWLTAATDDQVSTST